MSQLFDSLRRARPAGRRAPGAGATAGSQRAARTDAVLATLGFPRPTPRRRALVPLACAAVLAIVALAGWSARDRLSQILTGAVVTSSIDPRETAGPATAAENAPTAPPAAAQPRPTSAAATDVQPGAAPESPAIARAAGVARPPRPGESARRHRPGPSASTPGAAVRPNHFQLALYYHRAGDFENALVQYRTLLQQNELDVRAHNNLGLLYRDKGLLEDAAREFRRALIIDPRYASARNHLGVVLLAEGRLDEAAAEFAAVLRMQPRNVEALINRALVEKAAGQPERARTTLLRALVIDARQPLAHYNLAVLHEQTGETARALEHYRAFLEHAGPAEAVRAPEVRARIDTLVKR